MVEVIGTLGGIIFVLLCIIFGQNEDIKHLKREIRERDEDRSI